MKKLLDLRFVIGVFFAVVGLLLFIYHFAGTVNAVLNTSVNIVCSIFFTLFGISMIVLSYLQKIDDV
jgi:uncharacterized membrane protein